MSRKLVACAGTKGLLVFLDKIHRQFLGRMAIGQALGHHRQARYHESALDVLAAQTKQIIRGGAMGLVDLAFVAPLDHREVRRGGAAA